MRKPEIGEIVMIVGELAADEAYETGRVFAVHDSIDEWWDTAHGENKVALLDALKQYGEEKAATAEWYAEIENPAEPGETMAVASFEVKLIDQAQVFYTEPIPDYGDLMTREKWLAFVKDGSFIDYDGFGYPSDGKRLNRQMVRPSQADQLPDHATHVVWFNR